MIELWNGVYSFYQVCSAMCYNVTFIVSDLSRDTF